MEISLENSLISHRVSTVIATICIIIYVSALCLAGVRIYRNTVEQKNLAEQEFEAFVAYITSIASSKGFSSEEFHEAVTSTLGFSKTLQAAIINHNSEEYAFERVPDAGIEWNNGKPDFKNTFGFSKNPFSKALPIEDTRNVAVRVVYNYIDYGVLGIILKHSIIFILIGFCVSCITLLFRYLLIKDTVPIEMDDIYDKDNVSETPSSSSDFSPVKSESDDDLLDLFEAEDEDSLEEKEFDSDEPLSANISPDEFAGLFPEEGDFDTDLNQEVNVIDKLSEELHRSETFKQDLALIAAEIQGNTDKSVFSALASETMEFFVLQELVFERGKSGVSVIVPDTSVDDAFNKASEFRNEFLNKHPEFTNEIDVFIGISSRSEREAEFSVDANRMLTEAETALAKASKESPVVALRVDPEKYKEFLRKTEKD